MKNDDVSNALTDQEYDTMMSQSDLAQDWMVEQFAHGKRLNRPEKCERLRDEQEWSVISKK